MNNSIGYYCCVYLGFFVMTVAVIFGLIFALETYAPDLAESLFASGSSSGVGIVTILLPALMVAQKFYKNEQRRMTRGEGWLLAFLFTVMSFVISGALSYGLASYDPVSAQALAELKIILSEDPTFTAVFVGVFALIILLLNRLILWSGIRGEIKKVERAAIKRARQG